MIKKTYKKIKKVFRIGYVIGFITALPVTRRIIPFEYLFFTYAATAKDQNAYGPAWLRNLFPSIVPVGMLSANGRTGYGLMLGTAKDAHSFDSPEKLSSMQRTLFKWHNRLNTRSIALGGQLPGILIRNGVEITPPMLTGQYGTVFIIHLLVHHLLRQFSQSPEKCNVGILGVGYIGSGLACFFSKHYNHVAAVDKRPSETGTWPENVTYTTNPSVLADCDMVVILTGRGDEAATAIGHMRQGVIVVDDAHPQLPESLINQIVEEKKGTVYKAAVGLKGVRFIPRMPGFEPEWIPGCAIEAMVSARFGFDYHSQSEFNQLALQLDFEPLSVAHKIEDRN